MQKSPLKVMVIHGPNLNLLGIREPDKYGKSSLAQINQSMQDMAKASNVELEFFQSNTEGAIIDKIHSLITNPHDFIIINPAAFTHTSIALRDAILAVNIPFIEVHISNIYKREVFRHHSYFSDVAIGTISGLGTYGYILALQHLIAHK